MEFVQPTSWEEALAAKAALPASLPIAGGTDVMVELNFDRRRPEAILDLTRVPELRDWEHDGSVHIDIEKADIDFSLQGKSEGVV